MKLFAIVTFASNTPRHKSSISLTAAQEQNDQPTTGSICGAHKDADVIFLVEPALTGVEQARHIFDFIGEVTTRFSMSSGNIRVGHESNHCGGGDIHLGEYESGEELAKAFRKTTYSWMVHMVKRLRTHLFATENGGRDTAKHIAVLFVDDKLDNKDKLIEEARRARCEGIEVFVVAIGDSVVDDELAMLSSSPVARHIIRVTSYEALIHTVPNFLDRFCYGKSVSIVDVACEWKTV